MFYDFEVFKNDWLVVLINPVEKTEDVIINDKDKLEAYYNKNKNSIWIGYNSTRYDQYILKGILCGFDPKEISDFIIKLDEPAWKFSRVLNSIPLINYDVAYRTDSGLKSLEGFMGNNIKETSVDFDLDRKLTDKEIAETVKYCRHDVEQTISVFLNRKSDFDAHIGLIKAFDLSLDYMNKTKTQLAAIILGARRKSHDDEFEIVIPNTLKLSKYKYVLDWYLDRNNRSYDKQLVTDVAGVEHIFAWGGLHGAVNKYQGEGVYIMADVESLYPSLIIQYNYMSRNVPSVDKYIDIYNIRLKLKHEGKKKENLPYKSVLNSTYGAMKDKFNNLYDPLMANNICVAGQLLLLDLIEKLELSGTCDLIQTNTDGILIKLHNEKDFETVDDICYEWEKRTRLNLAFDVFHKVYQKDVNNYVLTPFKIYNDKGEPQYKTKGSYVKKLSSLDYDLPIVNKAMIEYMVNNTSIETTINSCDELKMFQKIVKVSGKYSHGCIGFGSSEPPKKICAKYENGWCLKKNTNCPYKQMSRAKCYEAAHVKVNTKPAIPLNDKTFRVFASKDENDGYIGKTKGEGKTVEKFANTPEHCFIENGDINDAKISSKLDKQWYIDLAYERLKQYGVL